MPRMDLHRFQNATPTARHAGGNADDAGQPGRRVDRVRRVGWFSLAIILSMPGHMFGAQANAQPAVNLEQPTAPVVVDGRVLFRVRGVSAYPAEQRARVIAARIEEVAADETISVDNLRIDASDTQITILSGDTRIAGFVDADAELEGVSLQTLAEVTKAQIANAIRAYRYDRSPSVLLRNILYSAGATILLLALLFGLTRLSRWLQKLVEARYRSRVQGVRIQAVQLVQSEQIWLVIRGFIKLVFGLSILASLFACAEYILSIYPWTRPLSERGLALILDPLSQMGSSVLSAVPNLIFVAILVLIVRYIMKLARLFFAGVAIGTVRLAGFDQEWAWPTYKIFRFAAIAFAVVIAYPYIPGAGTEAFKGVSIFLGVLFSFGSTSTVSNTIAGYAIVYRRVFKVGDRVRIGEHLGDVEEMRMQVTHLRSIKNEEIIIPNSEIMNSHVINYSSLAGERGLILHTTVGIGYETPWRQVEAMLLMAAERTAGLLPEPKPFVLQTALGDFCVTYEINVHCDQPQAGPRLYTELHRNILDLFNEYGVQIMTPAYEGDPEQAKVVPRDKWFESPARIPKETGDRGDSNPK